MVLAKRAANRKTTKISQMAQRTPTRTAKRRLRRQRHTGPASTSKGRLCTSTWLQVLEELEERQEERQEEILDQHAMRQSLRLLIKVASGGFRVSASSNGSVGAP